MHGLVLLAFCAAAAIAAPTSFNPELELAPEGISRRSAPIHFEYQGINGPAHWPGVCTNGTKQSPINLPAMTPNGDKREIALHFSDLAPLLTVGNNGHTFMVDVVGNSVGAANWVEYRGIKYMTQQFHFHNPSEHTFNGRNMAMELHIVNQAADGTRLVVGVFLDVFLPANRFFNKFLGKIPTTVQNVQLDMPLGWSTLTRAMDTTSYWSYAGSLTTPPCDENVRWIMLQNPVGISPLFVHEFNVAIPNNARFTQPVYDRLPNYSEESD